MDKIRWIIRFYNKTYEETPDEYVEKKVRGIIKLSIVMMSYVTT